MKIGQPAMIASCPDCAEKCYLGIQPKLEQKVTCPNCRSLLKVVSLSPLKLGWDVRNLEEGEPVEQYWKEESW